MVNVIVIVVLIIRLGFTEKNGVVFDLSGGESIDILAANILLHIFIKWFIINMVAIWYHPFSIPSLDLFEHPFYPKFGCIRFSAHFLMLKPTYFYAISFSPLPSSRSLHYFMLKWYPSTPFTFTNAKPMPLDFSIVFIFRKSVVTFGSEISKTRLIKQFKFIAATMNIFGVSFIPL